MGILSQISFSIVLIALCLSKTAYANGYVSIKEGTFKDSSSNFDIGYENNKGTFREVSFDFGNKDVAMRLNGNVVFNKENGSILGYGLGFVLANEDQLFVRTMHLKDDLWDNNNDPFWGGRQFIASVDASVEEVGYIRPMGNNKEGLGLIFMYGRSNMPTYYDVGGISRDGPGAGYFVDPSPKSQYLTIGIRRDEMRHILTDEKEPSGFQWYFDGDMNFGFIQQTTGSNIYGQKIYDVAAAGIENQKGYDGILRAFAEFGPAYVIRGNGMSGALSAGFYGEYFFPWVSGLLGINKTSTGESWGLGSHMGSGFNIRAALRF